jgi:hypothetical protein
MIISGLSKTGSQRSVDAKTIKHGLDQCRHRGLAGEAAAYQAAIDQHPPKSRIESWLRRGRPVPEAVEMFLVRQSRQVVNGFPDRADRRPGCERKGSRGTVHADQSARHPRETVEVAAVDEMEATGEAEPARVPPDEPRPVVEAGVERMGFEQEVNVASCVSREALDHVARRALHVGKRRMRPDLIIPRQLQREDEQRPSSD